MIYEEHPDPPGQCCTSDRGLAQRIIRRELSSANHDPVDQGGQYGRSPVYPAQYGRRSNLPNNLLGWGRQLQSSFYLQKYPDINDLKSYVLLRGRPYAGLRGRPT